MPTLVAHPTLGWRPAPRATDASRALLRCGVLAGPVYVGLALAQALTRPGFDLRRHDISLLANGSLGWIQIGNFVVSGLLVIAAAIGMRRVLPSGRGRTWGPLLVGLYGACIALAGVFVADPGAGFPSGTPAAANTMTWHGALHLLCAAVGFLALIAACCVFAQRFAAEGRPRWAGYSAATGAVFFVTFFGSVILSGSGVNTGLSVLGLWIAVLLGWSWLSTVSARGVAA
ncbi:MAG TPA: DUF998 domain-containing protein [Chloroflexota bacterium]|nr:DUF998 domain-containing protein [Chloroflexota bacterium]